MAKTTTNLGLTKPEYTEAADIGVINSNMDVIDAAVQEVRAGVASVGDAMQKRDRVYDLLDNSDWRNPVNQRGATNGNYTWGFILDRWQANGNSFVLSADGITVPPSGRVVQRIAKGVIDGEKAHTGVAVSSAGATYINANRAVTITVNTNNGGYDEVIVQNTGTVAVTVAYVALYEGEYTAETVPAYVPKGYAAELHECMRYYVRFPSNSQLTIIGYGYSATAGRFSIPVGVQMRAAPELTFSNLSSCAIYPGAVVPTGVGGVSMSGPIVTFGLTAASGITANAPAVLRPGTTVELSADL